MFGVILAGKLYGREPVMVIPAKTPCWKSLMLYFRVDSKISPGRHRVGLRDEMVEECRPRQDQEWRAGVLPPGKSKDNLALHFNGHTWSADITTAWDPWYFL